MQKVRFFSGLCSYLELGLENNLLLSSVTLQPSLFPCSCMKLALQYFDYLTQRTDSLEKKSLMAGKIEKGQRIRCLDSITD